MINHYVQSWDLYKLHSQSFKDDFDYYRNLCYGYKTLELFSGYGRLTNFLVSNEIDIESVELEPHFTKYINLPNNKNHTSDVLKFTSNKSYERIIAAYNSFCLFTEDFQIKKFFNKVNSLLVKNGIASLSYYPITSWKESPSQEIIYNDMKINYKYSFDFSSISNNVAIWIDEYINDHINLKFRYPTRIYKNSDEILSFTIGTDLKLIDVIENYNKNIHDTGWIEYVFLKR